MTQLSLHPTKVLISFEPEAGCLVCMNGSLVAVLVRLDAEFHGGDRGKWNLEAGFGPCEVRACDPFPTLADAVAWVAARVGVPPLGAARSAVGAENPTTA